MNAYRILYPQDEAGCSVFFAPTQESVKNIIVQCFLWTARGSMKIRPSVSMQEQKFKLSFHSRMLLEGFETACPEVINTVRIA